MPVPDTLHDGTCGFCGTSSDRLFITCTGCGATWKSIVTGWGLLMIQASWLVGAFLAFISMGVARSLGTVPIVFIVVTIGMVLLGLQMKTSAWFR